MPASEIPLDREISRIDAPSYPFSQNTCAAWRNISCCLESETRGWLRVFGIQKVSLLVERSFENTAYETARALSRADRFTQFLPARPKFMHPGGLLTRLIYRDSV